MAVAARPHVVDAGMERRTALMAAAAEGSVYVLAQLLERSARSLPSSSTLAAAPPQRERGSCSSRASERPGRGPEHGHNAVFCCLVLGRGSGLRCRAVAAKVAIHPSLMHQSDHSSPRVQNRHCPRSNLSNLLSPTSRRARCVEHFVATRSRRRCGKLLCLAALRAWLEPYGLPAAAITPARSAFARLGSTGWPCALALLVATALGCRAGPLAHGGHSCAVATTVVNRGAFERNSGSSATACTASLAALS